MYRDRNLYTFADNHDVNRAASVLRNPAHLFPLYGLLFTMPGIPSIYYGSERGIRGEKRNNGDYELRPAWEYRDEGLPPENRPAAGSGALTGAIRDFIRIRRENPALRDGEYRELLTAHEQFAFLRECPGGQAVMVAVNSAESGKTIALPDVPGGGRWRDLLSGAELHPDGGKLTIPLDSSWLRILKRE
jgi:glycosidase